MAKGHRFLGYDKPDKEYVERVRLDNLPVQRGKSEFFDLTVTASPVGHQEGSDGDPEQGGG